jgi:predicted metalloprotease with PDZ domain
MHSKYFPKKIIRVSFAALFVFLLLLTMGPTLAQNGKPDLQFTLSLPRASSHYFHVSLTCKGWNNDSLLLKMPNWMPGYYQLLNYSKEMELLSANDNAGHALAIQNINNNTWLIRNVKNKTITLQYDIKTTRQFVANSYADSEHAYLIFIS